MEKFVLIIEDTPIFSSIVAERLLKEGIHSEIAKNLNEAVKLLYDNAEHISCVILDGNIPVSSGTPVSTVPLIPRLKELLPFAPIIAYSADEKRVIEMLSAGCNRGVDKVYGDAAREAISILRSAG